MVHIGFFSAFCLIILITACQRTPSETSTPTLEVSLTDRSLVTGLPCKAPCWYGLEAGKSTELEVLSKLRELSFIDPNTVQENKIGYWEPTINNSIPAKLISASCKEPQGHQCVGLTIANDQLKIISLFPNYDLTFLYVVERLGNPDYVGRTLTSDIHSPGCIISLIWSSRHIIIGHIDDTSIEMCDTMNSIKQIPPELTTDFVTYLLPEYIELRIETSSISPWPGFAKH
jgi:hypothetical protein